jgi:lipopolysaccharide transport system ATP-binding protein
MSTVIKVENISKQYRLGNVGTGALAHDVNKWWHKVRGKENPYLKIGETNDRATKGESDYVWALKDINFEVKQGEVLGIIGRNGAGKSTLLKILSKTTTPTTGSIKIKGRIASLLEVGTGFHPELSGRENIFLNGAILGMTKQEIKSKFDEIVDFAGVERYIDTPVKRYSSGMYVRLAFGVAAHLEPEILIVDEVLAVGDAEFQKKALGKMKEVSEKGGRTVLFVSHNMEAISRLCKTGIFLKDGEIEIVGDCDEVVTRYFNFASEIRSSVSWVSKADAPGNNNVTLNFVRVLSDEETNFLNLEITASIGIEICFKVKNESDNYICGFNLYNSLGVHILSSHDNVNVKKEYKTGDYKTTVWIPENFLSEGIHICSIAIMSYNPFIVHFHEMEAVSFNVIDSLNGNSVRGEYGGVFPGLIRPQLLWNEIIKL